MYRTFALKAPDGTWGFRVHYVQNGQDTLVVRNVLQLKSEKQAMACAEAHLILLTNGAPGKVLGNPVEHIKLHEVDLRVFVESTEAGHRVAVLAYTPANKTNEQITMFTSNKLCASVEDIIDVLPQGIELVAKALTSFGMTVPPDWAPSIILGGTDEEFVATLRKAVGGA